MPLMSVRAQLRHWIILSRWQRWLFPVICLMPYVAILFWLLNRGLVWVAQVLLAPVVMGAVLAGMTVLLARSEFRSHLRRR